MHLDEDLLSQVIRRILITHDPVNQVVDHELVPVHKVGKGAFTATDATVDKVGLFDGVGGS